MTAQNEVEQSIANKNDVDSALQWALFTDNFDVRNLVNVVRANMSRGGDCFDLRGLGKVLAAYAADAVAAAKPSDWEGKAQVAELTESNVRLRAEVEALKTGMADAVAAMKLRAEAAEARLAAYNTTECADADAMAAKYLEAAIRIKELEAAVTAERERADKLGQIATLVGKIFFYGHFKAETFNERELEKLLRETCHFYESEDQVFAAALRAPEGTPAPAIEHSIKCAGCSMTVSGHNNKLHDGWVAVQFSNGHSPASYCPDCWSTMFCSVIRPAAPAKETKG